MKRFFWGLVKIGIIIGILVWMAQEFFPVSINQEKMQTDMTTEKLVEKKAKAVDLSIKKEISLVRRSAEPITLQQKKYALYSEKAGVPEAFAIKLTLRGTEPISAQLARAFNEPLGEWENFSVHSKTFWVLSELTLKDINVDIASSLNGAILTVKMGDITIDLSKTSVVSFFVSTPIVPNHSFANSLISTGKIESPLPTKKFMRRMSGRSWQQVLETRTRRGMLEKR